MAAENRARILLAGFALVLFVIFIAGITWFASVGQFRTTELRLVLLLAYVSGLSMIIMPCTLPLIFLIVPMTMPKKPGRGLAMAALFGLGLAITITAYGVATAWLGQITGLGRSSAIIILLAGIAAYIFGFSELGIFRIILPAFHGIPVPKFLQKQGDYLKSFFLGLILGNAGVGCPNPAFYVLLFYIAGTGDLLTGATVGLVHGLGRVTPLIMLSILGTLGVQAAQGLVRRAGMIKVAVAYALVFFGAYLLVTAIFGIGWWNLKILNYSAWVVLVALLLVPAIIKRFVKKREGMEEGHA